MKTLLKIALIASFAFAAVACNKDDEDDTAAQNRLTVATEDAGQTESVYDYTAEEAANIADAYGKTSGCASVTTSGTTFPKTITIDFGTGCIGQDGRTRKGIATAVLSDSMKKTGSTRTLTFTNHFVSDKAGANFVQVEGTHVLTNNGSATGCLNYGVQVTNGKLTFSDGTTRTWNCTRTRTQIAGCATPTTATDDRFEWTGASSGQTRNGYTFTATTTTPLQKSAACTWIDTGVMEVSVAAKTRTMDFGSGTCDDVATVTLANGTTKQVTLR